MVGDSQIDRKATSISKHLIQISIRELNNDLIKSNDEGVLSEVWKGKNY